MSEVRERVPLPAGRAYELFCNCSLLHWWVPGLRRATVLAPDAEGRPRDVRFEFAVRRVYVLRYSYDPATLRVRWEPVAGEREAVTGEAVFLPDGERSILVYREEVVGEARTDVERRIFPAADVARAFARYAEGC